MKRLFILISITVLIVLSFVLSINSNDKIFLDGALLAINVNGNSVTSFPSRAHYSVDVACNNATGIWDYDSWEAVITNIEPGSNCTFEFTTVTPINYANYIKSRTNEEGVFNEPATDWRYQGKTPNNWLYFNGELWRIIGTFQENTHGRTGEELVKIIRVNPLGPFSWQANNRNDWTDSAGSLRTLLNTFYYNGTDGTSNASCRSAGLGVVSHCDFRATGITNITYRNMIQSVTWRLGGHNTSADTAQAFYTAERGTTVWTGRPTISTGHIGLMYPSDYGFSVPASLCLRTTNMTSYNRPICAGESWLLPIAPEWFQTPVSNSGSTVFNIYGTVVSGSSSLANNYHNANAGYSVRPTLYLRSNVMYLAGEGSEMNPHIIICPTC